MTDGTHEISRLRGLIADAMERSVASDTSNFALLDFPDHPNVGDSAIWLGELALFRQMLKRRPAYVCSKDNFDKDELLANCPGGPVFIHGGGNFGDVWPDHQAFREHLIRSLDDRRIIQLPQTIYFSSRDALKRCATIINAHPDFTLLVRDRQSLRIANDWFACEALLCPDMALYLSHRPPNRPPSRDIRFLLRSDHESTFDTRDLAAIAKQFDGEIVDWLDEPSSTYSAAARKARLGLLLKPPRGNLRQAARERRYHALAQARVRRGLSVLRDARLIVTDRLHGHLLSLIACVPNVVLDNSYGKVSQFIELWTKDIDDTHLTYDRDDLSGTIQTLRRRLA